MIFCETNYEFGTRVEVRYNEQIGLIVISFRDKESGLLIGDRRYDNTCEREAVDYAKKLIAGEVTFNKLLQLKV